MQRIAIGAVFLVFLIGQGLAQEVGRVQAAERFLNAIDFDAQFQATALKESAPSNVFVSFFGLTQFRQDWDNWLSLQGKVLPRVRQHVSRALAAEFSEAELLGLEQIFRAPPASKLASAKARLDLAQGEAMREGYLAANPQMRAMQENVAKDKEFKEGLLRRAEAGEPIALRLVAEQTCTHNFKDVDCFRSTTKAAEAGQVASQHALALGLFSGAWTDKPDPVSAMRWLRKATDAGYFAAQLTAGRVLLGLDFRGGPIKNAKPSPFPELTDPQAAVQLLLQPTQGSNSLSLLLLADAYLEGIGVEKNGQRAVEILRPLAERGDRGAMNRLGDIYSEGLLAPRNPDEALRWYRTAMGKK